MLRRHKNICTNCRRLSPCNPCNICGEECITVSSRWRAPRKHNHAAWKMITEGDIMWDKKAIAKKNRPQWLRRWDLDGTQYCTAGHKLVQPNVFFMFGDFPVCACCRRARMDINNPNVRWRDLADRYYQNMHIH